MAVAPCRAGGWRREGMWSACSMGSWAAAVRSFAYIAADGGCAVVCRRKKTNPKVGFLICVAEILVARVELKHRYEAFQSSTLMSEYSP